MNPLPEFESSNKQLEADIFFVALAFRDRADHRNPEPSLFLSPNICPQETGHCFLPEQTATKEQQARSLFQPVCVSWCTSCYGEPDFHSDTSWALPSGGREKVQLARLYWTQSWLNKGEIILMDLSFFFSAVGVMEFFIRLLSLSHWEVFRTEGAQTRTLLNCLFSPEQQGIFTLCRCHFVQKAI